jgi:hypothetical protein
MSNLASLRYLSQSDLLHLGANHSNSFIEAITEGLTLHANKQFVQPLNLFTLARCGPYCRPNYCHAMLFGRK